MVQILTERYLLKVKNSTNINSDGLIVLSSPTEPGSILQRLIDVSGTFRCRSEVKSRVEVHLPPMRLIVFRNFGNCESKKVLK